MSKFYQNPFCNKCGRFHLDPDDLCGYSNRQQQVEAESENEVSVVYYSYDEGYNAAIDDAVGAVIDCDLGNANDNLQDAPITRGMVKTTIISAITALKK